MKYEPEITLGRKFSVFIDCDIFFWGEKQKNLNDWQQQLMCFFAYNLITLLLGSLHFPSLIVLSRLTLCMADQPRADRKKRCGGTLRDNLISRVRAFSLSRLPDLMDDDRGRQEKKSLQMDRDFLFYTRIEATNVNRMRRFFFLEHKSDTKTFSPRLSTFFSLPQRRLWEARKSLWTSIGNASASG